MCRHGDLRGSRHSRAGASSVFTFAPMPEKMPNRLPKVPPRDPKVDQQLKQNRAQQKASNIYWFLIMFLVPKEAEMVPKAPQKTPKTIPKGTQSAIENRIDENIPPGPSQRPILACFGVRVVVFCYISNFVCHFFCWLLQLSWLFNSFTSSFFSVLSSLVSLPFSLFISFPSHHLNCSRSTKAWDD